MARKASPAGKKTGRPPKHSPAGTPPPPQTIDRPWRVWGTVGVVAALGVAAFLGFVVVPAGQKENAGLSMGHAMGRAAGLEAGSPAEVQPVSTVAAFARAGERFEREFGKITLPVFILHGTEDKATRPDGSQQFFDEAGSADKTLKLYEGYYHDLLNDLGREAVFEDIDKWIEARLPAQQEAAAAGPAVLA